MIIAMAVISAAAVLATVIFLKNRFIWIYLSLFFGTCADVFGECGIHEHNVELLGQKR